MKRHHKRLSLSPITTSQGLDATKVVEKLHVKCTFGFTISRFLLILVILVVTLFLFDLTAIFLTSRSRYQDVPHSEESVEPDDSREKVMVKQMVATYLEISLKKSFSLNFEEVIKVRENNMQLYKYPYNKMGIDRRKKLSLQEFRDIYDGKWPVIVQDVVPTWKASNWSHQILCDTYGQERAVMKAVNGVLSKAATVALPLNLFCNHTKESSWHQWTYIEDELFIPMRPWLRTDVGDMVPGDDDFFLAFPQEVRPWNSMLLWGTAFSRSSLHIDPYNWTGTNAVIRGQKRWKLFPPGQDHFLYVIPGRMSEFPLNCYKYNSPIDTYEVDEAIYPMFSKTNFLEFDQYPGELLILPSGWFHQAFNVDETIAISSQFTNINNYRIILEEILKIGNVDRMSLPANINKQSPIEQVKTVMSMLPNHILVRGHKITEDILAQIQIKKES